MFWPPSGRANNKATISDAKFVAATGDAARFAPFTQDACFLAPWLSWDDDEGPWSPSDPLCRVILLGESGIQLRSLNTDTHGAILMLTSAPAGLQMWEVVSFFDWYEEGSTDKKMAMCWCRLWDGVDEDGGGGGGGGAPTFAFSNWHYNDAENDAFSSTPFEVTEAGYYLVVVAWADTSADLTDVGVDGTELTLILEATPLMTGKMAMWGGPGVVGPGLLGLAFGSAISEFNAHIIYMTGVTDIDPIGPFGAFGTSSTPSVSTAPTATTAAVNIVVAAVCSAGVSAGELAYASPFDGDMSPEINGAMNSRVACLVTSSVAYWTANTTSTTTAPEWQAILAPFH